MSEVRIVRDHSEVFLAATHEGMLRGLAAAGFRVQDLAMENIRENGQIDTGAMLSAIYVETPDTNQRQELVAAALAKARSRGGEAGVAEPGGELEADQVRIAEAMEYGIYQEMGTRHMAGRPYLGPAGEQVKGELAEIVQEYVNEALA